MVAGRLGGLLDGYSASHMVRTDGLEVQLRANGFTVSRGGHPVDESHIADVLVLLGLKAADVVCTYAPLIMIARHDSDLRLRIALLGCTANVTFIPGRHQRVARSSAEPWAV